MPIQGLVRTDYQTAMDVHNRHVTYEDAQLMIADAKKENKSESSGWMCCASEGTIGSEELRGVFEQNKDAFQPDAQDLVKRFIGSQGFGRNDMRPIGDDNPLGPTIGKSLLHARARHATWQCDWFPMTLRPNVPESSLFTAGGVCDKFDQATGKASRSHELANHQTVGTSWSGHCDMASRVCALLAQPVRNVVYNGVTFTPHDIQGLLVMISNDLAGPNEPFIGQRNNGNPGDDPAEPYPHVLMPEVIKYLKDGKVIVLDIDNGPQVWNYAFDQGDIQQFSKPRSGMREVPALNGGTVKYMECELRGTGYDAEIRHYKYWAEHDSSGDMISSGWFGDPRDTKRNPDFMWVPVPCGDLSRKSDWPKECSYNPQVDPKIVFDIYSQSI